MPQQYYVIKKILNNNVVISQDSERREVIVMGSGIGFGRHVRDVIDQKDILKVYALHNNAFENRFKTLADEIPFECFQLTEKIIAYCEARLPQKLRDGLILALADHIHFAVQQVKSGEQRVPLMNEEIRRLYWDEYEAGLEAVKMINDFYKIELLPYEAASIAFHLINSELNYNESDMNVILKGTSQILQIIEDTLGMKLDEASQAYARLVIHLKYFMRRVIIEHEDYKDEFTSALFDETDEQFIRINQCLINIGAYLKDTYGYALDGAERVYLIIHIARVLPN